VYSAQDVNDITGTVNLLQTSTLSYQAGKNAVINGGFDVWQRGTSSTTMTPGYFTADRWKTIRSGTVAGYTISRQSTFQAGTSYAIRLQRTAGNTTTDAMFLAYAIETLDWTKYQGKTLTLSFYAKGGANYSPTSGNLGVSLYTGTETDQDPLAALTGEVTQISANAVITTTATRYTYTFTCPSNSTDMRFNFSIAPTGTAGAADYVDITGVQIELGSYATTFSRTGGSYQGELAACQRYYWRVNAAEAYSVFTDGYGASATECYSTMKFPVVMRTSPTALEYSTIGITDMVTTVASTSCVYALVTNAGARLGALKSTGGLTAAKPYTILAFNSTSAYIGWSAEL
jgi:hypothetical protein